MKKHPATLGVATAATAVAKTAATGKMSTTNQHRETAVCEEVTPTGQ